MFIMMLKTKGLVLLLVLAIFGVDIDYELIINEALLFEYSMITVSDVDKDTITFRGYWLEEGYSIHECETTYTKTEFSDCLEELLYDCKFYNEDDRRELIGIMITTKLVKDLNLIKNLGFD